MDAENLTPAERLARSLPPPRRNIRHGAAMRPGPLTCRLRELRDALDLPASAVARAVGMSEAGISRIENGYETALGNARKLAEFFGVSIGDLWPTQPPAAGVA